MTHRNLPDVDEADKEKARKLALNLTTRHTLQKQRMVMANVFLHNIVLTREVNALRGELDIDPIPVYDPEV